MTYDDQRRIERVKNYWVFAGMTVGAAFGCFLLSSPDPKGSAVTGNDQVGAIIRTLENVRDLTHHKIEDVADAINGRR